MYYILMDAKTKSFYMKPRECAFYAYTNIDNLYFLPNQTVRLVETECEQKLELTTMMYNAGFKTGYIDNQKVILTSKDAYFYDLNPNEVAYAQYLLTEDTDILKNIIIKEQLLSICSIKDNKAYFPTVEIENNNFAALTYTDLMRIPPKLLTRYKGFKVVKMTFDINCVVNDKFIVD